MRSLKIKKRNSNTLLLERSKRSELIGFLLNALVIGSIFYSVFGQDLSKLDFINSTEAKIKEQPLLLIVLTLPLALVKRSRDVIKVFVKGDCYSFNLDSKSIRHNGNELVRFDEIKEVQIRVFKSDDFDSYNLSLITFNDKSILLEEHNDLSVTKELASNIADFIGVSVRIEN